MPTHNPFYPSYREMLIRKFSYIDDKTHETIEYKLTKNSAFLVAIITNYCFMHDNQQNQKDKQPTSIASPLNGECVLSSEALSTLTNLSVRTVNRILSELEQAKIIKTFTTKKVRTIKVLVDFSESQSELTLNKTAKTEQEKRTSTYIPLYKNVLIPAFDTTSYYVYNALIYFSNNRNTIGGERIDPEAIPNKTCSPSIEDFDYWIPVEPLAIKRALYDMATKGYLRITNRGRLSNIYEFAYSPNSGPEILF